MSSRKILVADYNTRELQRLKKLFSSQGYEVVTVQDGKMALDTFNGEQPDIVLLSAMLSKVNGFDVCKQIKASVAGKNVPVIIMTAVYKGQKYRVKAIHENKASEFLEKPVEDDVLLETVSRFSGDTRSLINKVKEEMREEEQADHKAALLEATPAAPEPAAAAPVPDEPEEAPVEEAPETTAEDLAEEDQKTVMIEAVAESEPAPTAQDDSDQIDRLLQAEISSTLMATQEEAKPSEVDDSLDQLLNKTLSGLGIDVGSDKPVSTPEPIRPEKEGPVPTEADVNATLAVEATLLAEPDTAELKFRKLEEDVIQEDKEELGKQAVENLLNSFDTDLEKKLSDTLSGVGLSDTNIEKVMDAPATPEAVEAVPEEEEDEEGTKFGDYVLIEKIGHGGMAELFKAKKRGEQGFQKILAIKRILPHLTDNQELVTMFIDEAKIAAQLTHQNIASIFDFGKIDNSYYIAMEFVDGFDLRKVLSTSKKEGIPIPHKMAVYIALQIASALDYAHHKKDFSNRNLHIVHRDVSPQNILISKEGEVKLLDFGISKAESKIHHTVKGALKGKLLYMSPEQAWGKSVEMQSDVYSLGIVLFEMVSGKVLFEDSSEFDVLEKVRSGKIPLLDNERKNLPPRLKKIVDKALQIEVVDRYQDAGEMARDLHDYLSHGGPVPTPKDLAAFLTRLYPENFNLSPDEVRHLGFAEFMEQSAPTRAKALSEDTVLMAAEEMEGLEILSPESSDAEATTVAPLQTEPAVSNRPVEKKATPAPEKKESPAAKAAAPSPKKSGKKKDTSRQTPASKAQEKKESKNKSVTLSPSSSQVEPPLFGGAEEKKSGSKVTVWAAVAVVVIALGVAAWVFLGGNQGGTAALNPPANVTRSNPEPTTADQAGTPASETGETPATTPAETDQPAETANQPAAQATPDSGRSEPQRPAAENRTTEKTPPVTREATTRSTPPETPAVRQAESKTPPVEQTTQNPPPAKEMPAQTTENSQPATKTPPAKITEETKSDAAASREAEAKPPEVKTPPPAKEAVVPARKQETPPPPPPVEKKAEEKPKPKAETPKPSMPVASGSGLQMSLPTQQQQVKEGDIIPLSDAKPPVLIRQVPPRYPETARNLKLQGSRLICRILVSHTGDVDKVVVVSSIPTRAKAALAGAAERALSQWKYRPATKDGVRVKVWTTITLAFN